MIIFPGEVDSMTDDMSTSFVMACDVLKNISDKLTNIVELQNLGSELGMILDERIAVLEAREAAEEKKTKMNERKACTKETPSDGTPYQWFHPDAVLISSHDYFNGGSYDTYKCPWCGITFDVTVPD